MNIMIIYTDFIFGLSYDRLILFFCRLKYKGYNICHLIENIIKSLIRDLISSYLITNYKGIKGVLEHFKSIHIICILCV